MKDLLPIILLFFIACSGDRDKKLPSTKPEAAYEEVKFGTENTSEVPDSFAKFPGGGDGIIKYCIKNIHVSDSTVKGRIVVSFIVNTQGEVQDAKIRKGINEEFDKEVVRVIKSMPSWEPAIKDGMAINIEYLQPFRF
jgi:protein TonB